MKALIEKTPYFGESEFITILQTISDSKSKKELKEEMENFEKSIGFNYFLFGFGSNHMWVSTKDVKERCIMVEFD